MNIFCCSFCLCFVMQHANSPEGYVQAKVSSVAAQLLKRGWYVLLNKAYNVMWRD